MPSLVNKQSFGIALLSSIPLWLPTEWGAHWMYPITLPWIVYWAHILVAKGLPRWYASFLPWIPALGMITWQRAILHLDLRYLKHSEGIIHPLKLMWQNQQNGWILLLGGAVGAWFIHRRMALVLALLAVANGVIEIALTDILHSLHQKNWTETSLWLLGIEGVRWTPLVLLWYNIKQRSKSTPYLPSTTLLMSLLALWLSGPFVSLLIWVHPAAKPTTQVPTTAPSLGMTLPIANPMGPSFASQLDLQGSTPLPKASWWCTTNAKPNWESQHRAFSGIELPAEATFAELKPHLFEIFRRGISHIGLLSESDVVHWYPPLAKHLRYPALHWYMTPPPSTARLAILDESGSIEWIRQGDAHCALTVSWKNTIQETAAAHLRLIDEHQCSSNVFLSFSESPSTQIEWDPPIPCPH